MEKAIQPIKLRSGMLQKYLFIEILVIAFNKKKVFRLLTRLNRNTNELLNQEKLFISTIAFETSDFRIKTHLSGRLEDDTKFFFKTFLHSDQKSRGIMSQDTNWHISFGKQGVLKQLGDQFEENELNDINQFSKSSDMQLSIFVGPLQQSQYTNKHHIENHKKCTEYIRNRYPCNTKIYQQFHPANLKIMNPKTYASILEDPDQECIKLGIEIYKQRSALLLLYDTEYRVKSLSDDQQNFQFLSMQRFIEGDERFLLKFKGKENIEDVSFSVTAPCDPKFCLDILQQITQCEKLSSLTLKFQSESVNNDPDILALVLLLFQRVKFLEFRSTKSMNILVFQNLHLFKIHTLILNIESQKEVDNLVQFMKQKSTIKNMSLTFQPFIMNIQRLRQIQGIQLGLDSVKLVKQLKHKKRTNLTSLVYLLSAKLPARKLRVLQLENVITSQRFWNNIGKHCWQLAELKISIQSFYQHNILRLLLKCFKTYRRIRRSLSTLQIHIAQKPDFEECQEMFQVIQNFQNLEVFEFRSNQAALKRLEFEKHFTTFLELLHLPHLKFFSLELAPYSNIFDILVKVKEEVLLKPKGTTKHMLVNIVVQHDFYRQFQDFETEITQTLCKDLNESLKLNDLGMTLAIKGYFKFVRDERYFEKLKEFEMLEILNKSVFLHTEWP